MDPEEIEERTPDGEKSVSVFIDKEELPVLVSNITSYLFREEWTHAFSD